MLTVVRASMVAQRRLPGLAMLAGNSSPPAKSCTSTAARAPATDQASWAGSRSPGRPAGVNQRRYEAVRAYVLEGAPLAEAAARFGYSPSALASLVRDFRAGKLALLAEPGRPRAGPPVARARRR